VRGVRNANVTWQPKNCIFRFVRGSEDFAEGDLQVLPQNALTTEKWAMVGVVRKAMPRGMIKTEVKVLGEVIREKKTQPDILITTKGSCVKPKRERSRIGGRKGWESFRGGGRKE